MSETKIEINGKEVVSPESWDDLNMKDFAFCYGVTMTELHDFQSEEQVQAKRAFITDRLLGLSPEWHEQYKTQCIDDFKRALGDRYKGEGELLYNQTLKELQVVSAFAFVHVNPDAEDAAPREYAIALTRTKNPFPELSFPKGKVNVRQVNKNRQKQSKYYGPADKLQNLSIYELGVAFTLFEDFMKERNPDKLHELLATLWRPSKIVTKKEKLYGFSGDRRIPYMGTEGTVPKRKLRMAKLSAQVKQMMLFWFASCRNEIIDSFPNVFSENKDQRPRGGNDYRWGGVLLALAGDLAKLPVIAQQKATDALTYLSYLEDQRKWQELKRLEESV